ncbi:hypothetical protein ACN27F_14820 [Solwaraspora sp. WMMB335]|uniref:hypothetical protein n=1 Tax=Solwaraspora sp. WMMB335 TaxID=3404118 RepID=UPI003B95CB16
MTHPGQPQHPGQPAVDPAGDLAAAMPPAAPKKSNAGKIVLIVLAAVLVLCLGGVAITFFAVRDEVGEVIEATQTRLVTPDTLAGQPISTDPDLQTAATEMVTEMESGVPEATSSIGAFYGDVESETLFMIAGVSGLIAAPEQEMADVTDGALGFELTNVVEIDLGSSSALARCGDTDLEGEVGGLCVWVDRGALALVLFYFADGAEAASELIGIRDAVQQTS